MGVQGGVKEVRRELTLPTQQLRRRTLKEAKYVKVVNHACVREGGWGGDELGVRGGGW